VVILVNNVSQILLRPMLVAMAKKFETKWAITQSAWEISRRYLHLVCIVRDQ